MNRFSCELIGFLGLACLVYGLWQIYEPLAPIIAGLACLVVAGSQYPQKQPPESER